MSERVYEHQAQIVDNPWFQLRVRQALAGHALAVMRDSTASAAAKTVAQLALDKPEPWSQAVAPAMGALLVTSTAVTNNSLTDEEISDAIRDVFAAYVPVSNGGI